MRHRLGQQLVQPRELMPPQLLARKLLQSAAVVRRGAEHACMIERGQDGDRRL
jgi:hypothetical protein